MAFKVSQIVSANSFNVSPEWRIWKLRAGGSSVVINNFNVPDKHANRAEYNLVKEKLANLLQYKTVELKPPFSFSKKKELMCDVLLDGVHINELIPECKPQANFISETTTEHSLNETNQENSSSE
ncbi:MAG: hypothetical protein J0M08_10005 [Bacteroidetes bacterium]|nr:hypothetical protein [Bacteroidota bacterium]